MKRGKRVQLGDEMKTKTLAKSGDHPLLVIPRLSSALIGLHKEGRGAERMEKGEREGR